MNLIDLSPDERRFGAATVSQLMRFTLVTTIRRPAGYGIIIEELNDHGNVVKEYFVKIPYANETSLDR